MFVSVFHTIFVFCTIYISLYIIIYILFYPISFGCPFICYKSLHSKRDHILIKILRIIYDTSLSLSLSGEFHSDSMCVNSVGLDLPYQVEDSQYYCSL